MFHKNRRWVIAPVASVQELAHMLTQRTWTLCSGFYVERHPETIFLNDATHEDGAAEYGVTRRLDASWIQVESITFSWMDESKAAQTIQSAIAGEFDANDFARKIDLEGRLDQPNEHGRCHLCA
jgi:hypothetical protein